MRRLLFLILVVLGGASHASPFDSLNLTLHSSTLLSSQSYLPHYLLANNYDLYDPFQSAQAIVQARVERPFGDKTFDYAYGVDLVANTNFSYSRFQQAYLMVKYGPIQLRGGRWQHTIGIQYDSLSVGSLGLSANARPLPKIFIGIPEYTAVPLTRGYVQIKGGLSHGWFEADRFTASPYLHEKYLYLKLGGDLPVRFITGLAHFAHWGGEHPSIGELPASFNDYWKIFTASSAGEDSGLGGEIINVLGNHLGVLDFGLELEFKNFDLMLYNQYPYEDQSNLHTIIKTNLDRLAGLHFTNKSDSRWITHVLYEFMTTTYQSGPGLPDPTANYPDKEANYGYDFRGRDDFHNNYLYRSGWTYQNRIMGSPLFFTRERAKQYLPEVTDTYGRIVNNRIKAHHLAIQGLVKSHIAYKLRATFTRNYGTYAGNNQGRFNWASKENPDFEYAFRDGLNQSYFSLETSFPLSLPSGLYATANLAIDSGQLSDALGIQLGVRWQSSISFSK